MHRYQNHYAAFFSRLTPLNFFLLFFFTAMNLPPFLLRFAHAGPPSSLILIWLRLRTAPLRALSPNGLLTAIGKLLVNFDPDSNAGPPGWFRIELVFRERAWATRLRANFKRNESTPFAFDA